MMATLPPTSATAKPKARPRTTTAASDDNGAALEGNQVIHGARQELVWVPIEDRLAYRRGLLGCHCTIVAWVLAGGGCVFGVLDGGVGVLIYLLYNLGLRCDSGWSMRLL